MSDYRRVSISVEECWPYFFMSDPDPKDCAETIVALPRSLVDDLESAREAEQDAEHALIRWMHENLARDFLRAEMLDRFHPHKVPSIEVGGSKKALTR